MTATAASPLGRWNAQTMLCPVCILKIHSPGCTAGVQGISVEELSVEQFRRKCVEPMGEESDEVHIVALADVLQVGARV